MMTKRHKANLLRDEFTTQELRIELQKRERKSWQRQVLDSLLETLNEKEIRAVLARLQQTSRAAKVVEAIEEIP
jgi:hypothetical protein